MQTYVSGYVNSPLRSKINITSVLAGLVGAASAMGYLPKEAQQPITDVTLIVVGTLIPIFRTWFTAPK